jgi:hypothetical protein
MRSNKNSLFDMAAKLKKYAAYIVYQLNALPAQKATSIKMVGNAVLILAKGLRPLKSPRAQYLMEFETITPRSGI